MAPSQLATRLAVILGLFLALHSARDAQAVPTVWSGPTISFQKMGEDTGDPTDPLNQDRLTNNVWLTRAGFEGMFNIAPGQEELYTRHTSPADTLWATSAMPANSGKTISAALWQQQNLVFTTWAAAFNGPGPALATNILTHNAVVHLLTDDIYLDLTFTSFSTGGVYSYTRSTPAVAGPTGDYNHNNAVDAGDYVVWRRTLGSSASPSGSGADGNSNGTIDPGDYTYWRQRYGNAPVGLGSALAPVPEPSTAFVSLSLLALILCKFRARGWV